MFENPGSVIPPDHPIRAYFHALTERGLGQQRLHDAETIQYLTDLLADFIHIENAYRIQDESGRRIENLGDLMSRLSDEMPAAARRDYYKYMGDITLFSLGLFPEHLSYGRRSVSPDYYAEQGRRSYYIVSEMDFSRSTLVYRKLFDHFEQCVAGLNWVKLYINDPFYQYMFREFGLN